MVLDVGCGMGALAEAIQNKGYIVWGIDLNKEAAQTAAKRIAKVINADLTDITSIKTEIGDQYFDYIIFSDILEHIHDPLSILKEYLAFLKDGGYALSLCQTRSPGPRELSSYLVGLNIPTQALWIGII